MNKVILVGRLGRDPEAKQTNGGTSVCNMSVATDERQKNPQTGEWEERAEWHRVACFGKLADNCAQHLSKGREVAVVGRLQTRSWEKDGQKHYQTEIIADSVEFIGGRGGNGRSDNDPPPLGE